MQNDLLIEEMNSDVRALQRKEVALVREILDRMIRVSAGKDEVIDVPLYKREVVLLLGIVDRELNK